MKNLVNENKGITLLALIITVIVMLVLAGVSLSMVFGEDGVIKRAYYAAEEQRGAAVEEHRDDWKNTLKLELYPDGKKAQELEDLVNDLKKIELITEEEAIQILNEGFVEIGSRKIIFETILKVGSIVKYNPNAIYEWKRMYASPAAIVPNIKKLSSENNNEFNINEWRVFEINNEKVKLVPKEQTKGEFSLGSAQGYNNGVYLLNEACSILYGNEEKNIKARSININDIEEKTICNVSDQYWYGKQFKTLIQSTYYPKIYSQEILSVINKKKNSSGIGVSEQNALIEIGDNYGSIKTNSIQPYYTAYIQELNDTVFYEKYYDILLPNLNNTQYWIASRCIYYHDEMNNRVAFGLQVIENGKLNLCRLNDGGLGGYLNAYSLFPILELDRELILVDDNNEFYVDVE